MLNYAKSLVGKPFSNMGMARSIMFPRQTDDKSFFCAGVLRHATQTLSIVTAISPLACLCTELVASVLKRGGLMSPNSNPGAATPQSLHRLYKSQAAVTANPYTLRQFNNVKHTEKQRLLGFHGLIDQRSRPTSARTATVHRKRGDSPPRASFRCVSTNSSFIGH